jgi:hypothetical protein
MDSSSNVPKVRKSNSEKQAHYHSTLNIPSIDSLKWRIELDKVDVLNRNITDHIINSKINTATGEIIEETPIQSNSLKIHFEHYHIHFAINKIFGVEYLVVLINSKLLEQDYLNGISMRNIEALYNKIMSCNVFECSFEQFLSNGMVSDIDIKKDLELNAHDLRTVITHLDKGSKPHKSAKYGCNAFTQKDNLGIEWNTRKSATHRHPFLKIYHKGIESEHSKNRPFFEHYIGLGALSSRTRIEVTIKSYKEAQKHGFKDNTLLTLLKATTNDLNTIIEHSVTSNLEPRLNKVERKNKDKLNNTELIMYLYLTELIKEKGISFKTALEHVIDHQDCKVQRSRLKTALTRIYEEQIEGQKYEVKTRSINSFFDNLGWK